MENSAKKAKRLLRDIRDVLPKQNRDRLPFAFAMLSLPFAIAFEVLVVYPLSPEKTSFDLAVYLSLALFFAVNYWSNLYSTLRVDASGRQSDLPSVLKPGWSYCYVCHLNAPPRAYHCNICNACILKRDSHCSFTGCCVGYYNHRSYVVCILYAFLSSILALAWHWNYIWGQLGGFSIGSVLCVLFPQFAMLFGYMSFWQLFLSGIQFANVTVILTTAYFICRFSYVTVCRGQTWHEFCERADRRYDQGPWLNWKDVMGERWLLALICPWTSSPLIGDGIRFQPIEMQKNI